MVKVTPEIEAFITDNHTLTCRALVGLIENKFKIKITFKTVNNYLEKARAENASKNSAKIEAVRSKILDDADQWANKYLKYLDEEVECLRSLKETGQQTFKIGEESVRILEITDIKDRIAVSQTLHKYLSTVIEFVKPKGTDDSSDVDLDAKLDQLIERRKARAN